MFDLHASLKLKILIHMYFVAFENKHSGFAIHVNKFSGRTHVEMGKTCNPLPSIKIKWSSPVMNILPSKFRMVFIQFVLKLDQWWIPGQGLDVHIYTTKRIG